MISASGLNPVKLLPMVIGAKVLFTLLVPSLVVVYALLDGLFQHALLRQLAGDVTAAATLDANVRQVLPTLLIGQG